MIAAEANLSGVVRLDLDGVTVERAYGLADRAHCIANTPNTQFATASGTKGLTALAVMSLVEQGRFGRMVSWRCGLDADSNLGTTMQGVKSVNVAELYEVDQPVKLALAVKNGPTLIVKVYEVNTFNVYRSTLEEVNTALDLDGFQFDDLANGGSTPYSFAAGTLLPAHGFLVLFRSQSGVALNNTGGDDVRLLAPDGRELQAVHYASAHDDHAWSALPDGSDAWSGDAAPSPGRSTCAETGRGTPTPTPLYLIHL